MFLSYFVQRKRALLLLFFFVILWGCLLVTSLNLQTELRQHWSQTFSIMQAVKKFWNFYCLQLEKRPLLARCATGAVGSLVADALAQGSESLVSSKSNKIASERSTYDAFRTLRLMLYSTAIGTPIAYVWFKFLDHKVLPHAATSPRAVLTKVLLDQTLMAPLGLALFLIGMKALEGRPHLGLNDVKDKFVPAIKANYLVWPAAHIFNFTYISPSQRILFINVVSVLWVAFMSNLSMGSNTTKPIDARRKL